MKNADKTDSKKWDKNLETCRIKLQTAENELAAWTSTHRANELNEAIKKNKIVLDILAPAGLRKSKLQLAIAPFNKILSEFSEVAGWPQVRMDVSYNFTFAERPVQLCSKSERFKASVIIRLAMSKIENPLITIIDGVDVICGKDGRNNFINLILGSGVPVIFFMSVSDLNDMPALSKAGGISYWVQEGELKN